MRIKTIDIVIPNVDADGICASQAPVGAGSLTLDGALSSAGDLGARYVRLGTKQGQQIAVTSDANETGTNFVVTGLDQNNKAATETIAGPNIGTTEGTVYWSYISSITISAAAVGNITVGTVDEILRCDFPLDWRSPDYNYQIECDISGTINYGLEVTYKDILGGETATWAAHATLTGETSDQTGVITDYATGMRIKINSYTDGATLKVTIIPS